MTNIHAKELGKLGGRKSVEKRFLGKSKKEISEVMRNVRYTKREKEITDKMALALRDGLNKNMTR